MSSDRAKGFEVYRSLTSPLHRAIRARGPHHDECGTGGGRREHRIIVRTVYRNNYLIALKALSHNGIPGALVRMLDFAQRSTAGVDFAELVQARVLMSRTHAFDDPTEADAAGIRLMLPAPDIPGEAS